METDAAPAAPPPEAKRSISAGQVALWLLRGRTLIVLILLIIVFSLISSDYLTQSNLISMTKHVSVNAILAIGVTFVILTGGIDLSVGSIAGFASMVAGFLLYKGVPLFGGTIWFSTIMVIILSIGVGGLFGAINGVIITRFRVAPFIATLGMLYIARGLAQICPTAAPIPDLAGTPEHHNQGFHVLGVDSWLGIPVRCGSWSRSRRSPSWSRPAHRSAGGSTRSAATTAPRCCPASGSPGSPLPYMSSRVRAPASPVCC